MWGYLIPLDQKMGGTMVLRKRSACPMPSLDSGFGSGAKGRGKPSKSPARFQEEEEQYEETKAEGIAAGGYLIGRHPECGMLRPACEELQT